jgi:hypothetical protein
MVSVDVKSSVTTAPEAVMVMELVTVTESVAAAGHVDGLAEAVVVTVDGVREGHAGSAVLATDVIVIVVTPEQPVPLAADPVVEEEVEVEVKTSNKEVEVTASTKQEQALLSFAATLLHRDTNAGRELVAVTTAVV